MIHNTEPDSKGFYWPAIFVNPDIDPPADDLRLCKSIALEGWALCSAGGDIPDNFGKGMAKLAMILPKITPKELMEEAP